MNGETKLEQRQQVQVLEYMRKVPDFEHIFLQT